MTWGPELRRELVELFREAYEAGGRARRLRWEHLGMREGWPAGDVFGLNKVELAILETLTVEQRYSQAVNRNAVSGSVGVNIRKRLVKFELIRAWQAPLPRGPNSDGCFSQPGGSRAWQGTKLVWYAEITQRGWCVLLGRERARRG